MTVPTPTSPFAPGRNAPGDGTGDLAPPAASGLGEALTARQGSARRRWRARVLVASTLAAAVANVGAPGGAGAAEEGGEPRRVEPVVVTATKVETAASELGASVSVVPE